MKEISYVHSESILTNELGHRVLAVASDNPPIIAFATKDAFSPKIASCIDQIIERKGNPIIICNKGHKIWEQDKQKRKRCYTRGTPNRRLSPRDT